MFSGAESARSPTGAPPRDFDTPKPIRQGYSAMGFEPLMGRYVRLQQELSIAYRAHPWLGSRIDRLADDLADDLAETKRDIGTLHVSQREGGPRSVAFAGGLG